MRITNNCPLAFIFVIAFSSVTQSQSLDLQERCSAQAEKTFQAMEKEYNSEPSYGITTVGSDYQNHYNVKLNRCLMLTDKTTLAKDSTATINTSFLIDANERRPYAFYMQIGLKVMSCELTPSIREKTLCQSREQFDAFVADYMEK
jgi:hypothetical protein